MGVYGSVNQCGSHGDDAVVVMEMMLWLTHLHVVTLLLHHFLVDAELFSGAKNTHLWPGEKKGFNVYVNTHTHTFCLR